MRACVRACVHRAHHRAVSVNDPLLILHEVELVLLEASLC
jgi:hypothetical protein